MSYIMESDREGRRIEAKTDKQFLLEELGKINFQPNAKVLDLGCAAGTTSRIIKEFLGANGAVVGIDVSEKRISEARTISNDVEYRVGNAEFLPAEDEEFDVSWSRFTFEYLKNPLQVVDEMARVTKKGGKIAIADIDGNCLWHYPVAPDFERDLAEAVSFLSQAGFDPFIGRKLYSLFKQAGLKDINVDIHPYHKIVGRIDENLEKLWRLKFETIIENLVKMGWGKTKVTNLTERFLEVLRDENVFTYSILITVIGTK